MPRTKPGTKEFPYIIRDGVWKSRPNSGGVGRAGKRKAQGWHKGWAKVRRRAGDE